MSGQAGSGRWNKGQAGAGRRTQAMALPALLLLGCCVFGMTAVWAQKASPELTACVAANRQAATELLQARDSEIRRHALHAVLVSRLQGLGNGFNALKAGAARNPRNLAECEKTTEALTAGREQMERIVGTPEQLAECKSTNQAAYGEMQATLLALQSRGQASVPALEAAASRLALLRPAMTRPDLTLADCRQLTAEVDTEKLQVQRLLPAAAVAATVPAPAAAPAPAPVPAPAAVAAAAAAQAAGATACRTAQTRDYNEVAQAYAQFVGAGPLAQEWMATLQSLSERLTRLSASIATPGAPGWNCEGINQALAQARIDLGKLKR